MKVVEVSNFGEPEVMAIVERPMLKAGPGQVVVRVEAIGVNPVDSYIRAGIYPVLPDLPYTPGGNAAGTVFQCGSGVTSCSVGQRVYTATKHGAYGEYCLCQDYELFPLPEGVSAQAGAALGIPAATAYRALFIRGEGKAGERVLIHGASGSVGLAALQLGRAATMEIDGTAGSEEGLELIRANGAGSTFLHSGEYVDQLRIAAPKGYDLILEMLANKNLETDLSVLAPGGRVIIVGSRGRIEIDPRATMGKETDIRGLALANASREELQQTYRALDVALREGVLQPVISQIMPLTAVVEAHHKVMESNKCGKIVLIP